MGGSGPETGWVGVAGTAAAARRWRSRWSLETGRRSAAAGWTGSCDAGMAAGSGCGNESVGDGGAAAAAADDVAVVAAVAAAGGAAASVGAAAGAGAGSSVMR